MPSHSLRVASAFVVGLGPAVKLSREQNGLQTLGKQDELDQPPRHAVHARQLADARSISVPFLDLVFLPRRQPDAAVILRAGQGNSGLVFGHVVLLRLISVVRKLPLRPSRRHSVLF